MLKEDDEVAAEEVAKEVKKRAPKKKTPTPTPTTPLLSEDVAKEDVAKEDVAKEVKKRSNPRTDGSASKSLKKKNDNSLESEEGNSSPIQENQKRGRKPKKQIVECNTDVNVNAGNSQEDQLAELVNQLTIASNADPEDIDVEDLDNILSDMEKEETVEQERVSTPRLPEQEPKKDVKTASKQSNNPNEVSKKKSKKVVAEGTCG